MNAVAVVDEIEALFEQHGGEPYGERVTLFEHSLLTAQTAEEAGASEALVTASLLHDIGHVLAEPDDGYGKHTHDEIGGSWLAGRFPAAVSEPVRLHVAAKRYLCGVDPAYFDVLSPASQYTLAKQGGPMTAAERESFAATPFHAEAVRLRHWEDEFGKRSNAVVPPFSRYRPLLERLAAPR